jgi:hypothetical protein
MDRTTAEQFVAQWIAAWNNHDISAIMEHYADDIDFNSPFIREMGIDVNGYITNKTDLKAYFEKALQKNPGLHFDLQHILVGSNSIVMFYKRMNKSFAGEYIELNEHRKIIRSRSHYTSGS